MNLTLDVHSCLLYLGMSQFDLDYVFVIILNFLLNYTDFRDVTLCESCKNRRFGGKYYIHLQGEENQ
jgi:hypothetical protein